MFLHNLFESDAKRVIVTYPGRFQPFHRGHYDVFSSLVRKFGSDNVFIVTGNKTDSVKSPFNFSDKVRFMHAMGVPDHNIIETDKVYDLPAQFESIKDKIVFITVVGEPDEARLQPGKLKKDGSPSYFQKPPGDASEYQTADQHGYVIVEPEHPEMVNIGGQQCDASHGTECRELWNRVRNNPAQRAEFIHQLYGRDDPELGAVLDKIPSGAPEPAPKASPKLTAAAKTPAGPKLKPVKVPKAKSLKEFAFHDPDDGGGDGFNDDTLKMLAAQWYNGDEDPGVERTLAAAGWEIGQDEGYDDEPGVFVVQAGDVNGNSYMSWPAHELKGLAEGIETIHGRRYDVDPNKYYVWAWDSATVIYGEYDNIKDAKINLPKIEQRAIERLGPYVKGRFELSTGKELLQRNGEKGLAEDAAGVGVIANKKQKNDPRYSMSMSVDVGPGADLKAQRQLSLMEKDRLRTSHKRNRFKTLGQTKLFDDDGELHLGDPVIITGDVEFKGKTGDVDSFGSGKKFVVVNLYNHGPHSFHASDVSYNRHADDETEETDEGMYQYNNQDPMNSEFAPEAGMGRMTLRGWKQSLARRVAQLAKELEASSHEGKIDKDYLWQNVYKKLQALNLDPIAQEIELAHQELENIRRRGGVRSRAFKQYDK